MQIDRLRRLLKRINDLEYLNYLIRQQSGKIMLHFGLRALNKHHNGIKKDFNGIKRRRLKKIVKYAYVNSEYYRDLFNERNIDINKFEDFLRIPFLDKEIIKREKSNLMALSNNKDYVGFVTTGGSTGEPLGFHTLGSYDAEHQAFLFKMFGYKSGDRILAMDGSIIPDNLLDKNVFWIQKSRRDLPYGSVALSSQYLTNDNIDSYIHFIKEFKPDIIRGYPSFINTIACHINKQHLNLALNIKAVELTSESFYDDQIINIQKAFNTKIINQYGHAEASIFGYSIDETLTTFCSPFYGFTEIIGEDGRAVNKGEIGEVVVTGFNNYAMPFIRYRTGDMALYDGEDYGITKFKKILGRTQDYIYTREMEKVLLTAIVFGRHYKAFDHIKKWQIIQDEPGNIIFKIIKDDNFSTEDQLELQDNFYKIAQIETSFEFVNNLPLTPRGKSKLLIQNINL
ncbi:phenylacetate--CoA ligase family protein [Paenibacillus sp. DMB5]|uniref:phenylacetate--CoA ligase family protein n=1 Tax=Paenibacillus sp. DMB5 TaxID=1780103 RepID=UPI00076C8E2A|nr:phenylacetate--CoA ligase family protein [Paenibacillus sp. DMB5]KUP22641.1 hypothetical protein AWJ19_33870 [Paenibacillus sp. DMB5]